MTSRPVTAPLLAVVLVVFVTACVADLGGREGPGGPRGRPGGERGIGQPRQFAENGWRQYDVNGDGRITRAEFLDVRSRCFDWYDENGDGILTRSEVRRRLPPRLEQRLETAFSQMDRNEDGQISRGEFEFESIRLFQRLDKNGYGVIAGYELAYVSDILQDDICSGSSGPPPGSPGEFNRGGGRRGSPP